jgi:hypothetical protein
MSFKFDLTLSSFLDSQTDRCLLLGDASHGKKSLNLLKGAVQRLSLDLRRYEVMILVEGSTRFKIPEGDEECFRVLEQSGAEIRGCENDKTLSAENEINEFNKNKFSLADGPIDAYMEALAKKIYLEGKRMVDANNFWERMIATELLFHAKVILCCGTSHLPKFTGVHFKGESLEHRGLMNTRHLGQDMYAFSVEPSNDGIGWYIPEKFDAPNCFGKVRTIE